MPHKLLLADDSVTIQRVIELTFADEDIQVIAVGDGKLAIQRAQQDKPDIILADVGMPERDGYEVAEFVKRSPELQHIPVLLLTGAFEPIDEGRARAVGCDGVLVKPFEPQLVINRVKDLLAGRRTELVQAPPRFEGGPRQAPAPAPVAPPPAAAAASGSIEDYFDRLDAAFANMDTGAAPPAAQAPLARGPVEAPAPVEAPRAPAASQPQRADALGGLADELAGWDPEITGDPARPAAQPPAGVQDFGWQPAPEPVAPALDEPRYVPTPEPPAPTPAPRASDLGPQAPRPELRVPSAERVPTLAEAFAALLAAEQGRPFSPAAQPSMPVDEKIVEDITRRVLDRLNVRDTVLEVAERLVREEIDRIKSNAR